MPALVRLVCLLVALAWPLAAAAQDYPTKTIKFVVPFPAGGPADTFARVLGDKLATSLGQPVVIENRAGAGGLTGTASVAKSDPDGHTMGIAASSALAINVNLRDNMPFQPLKDFHLLTQIVSVPELLVVSENVPAKSLAELIALAEGPARQARLRLDGARRHAASGHRVAQDHRWHRAGACGLYRRSSGRERSPRRPRADDVRGRAGAARRRAGGQAARAGDWQPRCAARSCPTCRPPPSSACPT